MISRRRVTADVVIQLLLLISAFLIFYRAGTLSSDGVFFSMSSIFLGGWWLAPIVCMGIWQFVYNTRLNRYFRYSLRKRLNYLLLTVLIAKVAVYFYAAAPIINTTVNLCLLLTVVLGFLLSCRDYVDRVYRPTPFWQLR